MYFLNIATSAIYSYSNADREGFKLEETRLRNLSSPNYLKLASWERLACFTTESSSQSFHSESHSYHCG